MLVLEGEQAMNVVLSFTFFFFFFFFLFFSHASTCVSRSETVIESLIQYFIGTGLMTRLANIPAVL